MDSEIYVNIIKSFPVDAMTGFNNLWRNYRTYNKLKQNQGTRHISFCKGVSLQIGVIVHIIYNVIQD